MTLYLTLILSTSLLNWALASYSVYLPESLSQQYSQQDRSSVYWPDTERTQEYDDDAGYRYQQSYQSSYRQQIQSIPYTTTYPTGVYQPLPPSPVPSYQLADRSPVPPSPGVLPSALPSPNLPIYQLVTIGPEVPVLVRLPNQQTAILPVRTVYSLPGFLERIVQRVQNFYSVYNPLEVLKIPRLNETEPESTTSNTPTTSPEKITTPPTATTTTPKVPTLNVEEVIPTSASTTEAEETTTDSNSISADTTTAE